MRPATRLTLIAAATLPLLTAAIGCREELETGYQYRRLTSTPGERKGYYAPAFSPEAQAAGVERQDDFRARRPGGGY